MKQTSGEVVSVGRTGYFVNCGGENRFCIVNNSFYGDERPIVGDVVTVETREDRTVILGIKPRRSVLVRNRTEDNRPRVGNMLRAYDLKETGRAQYFAANVDVLFIVTSANREFSAGRVKRFAALASGQGIRMVVVLTKTDLCRNSDVYARQLEGFDWVSVNARDAEDVKKLFKFWQIGETALLAGASGVGKSTLVNSLCGLNLKTRDVMDDRLLNRGRHTTSARTLYYLPCGRKIIDMPGVRFVNSD